MRHDEFRTYNNIVGDYYVAPRFLMRVAMHTAKNYLADHLRSVKIPLILGIWGTGPCTGCVFVRATGPARFCNENWMAAAVQ